MRFRYPILYIIGLGGSLIFCSLATIFSYLYEPNIKVAIGFAIASLVSLFEFYSMTHSIWVDEHGIRLDSIFGEVKKFSWNEIVRIKSTGIFSPGVKLFSQLGESITISSLFGNYDVIINLISRHTNISWDKDDSASASYYPLNNIQKEPSEINFEGKSWRWISVPLFFLISVFFFYISLKAETTIYLLFGGAFLIILFPVYVYGFFREPMVIETKKDFLYIKFRSDIFREPIQVPVDEIIDISLIYHRNVTSHGAIHPSTDLQIIISNQAKIKVSNFISSNEEIYMKLSEWLAKQRKTKGLAE